MRRNTASERRNGGNDIVRVFARIAGVKNMRRFFEEIFTPGERRDLALRWRLMEWLHSGVPQRDIAAELGISLCKITRGSRVLKERGSVTRRIMDAGSGGRTGRRSRRQR